MAVINLKRTLIVCLYMAVCMTLFNSPAKAAATGEFIAVNQDTNGAGLRALSTLDGKGGGYTQFLESSVGLTGGGSFTIADISDDGTFTVSVPSFMTGSGIISADGNIMSVIYVDDGYSQLSVAIKKSSGMSNAKLKGEYIIVNQNTKGDQARMLATFDGQGKGTYQALEITDGELPSGSLTYTVNSDGSLIFTVPGIFTGHGIVSPDGKIAAIFINGDGFSEIAIMIQKSTGMSNSALNGQYIAMSQEADIDDKEDSGCRILVTFDGNGNGSYQALECSSEGTQSGPFTYHVSPDGTFTLASANPTLGQGIITADGGIGILSFIDKPLDDITLLVFVEKSSGTDNDGDGYTESQDCDDNDATRYPGAIEICDDGIDQDCDGYDETSIDAPAAPSGLAANAVSFKKILLRWTDKSPGKDSDFKIERKVRGCGSSYQYAQIATVQGDNKFEDVNFEPGSQYSYRVRAYKGLGNSDYSNCSTTTASASGTPSAPVNLVATYSSSSTVNLSWDEWSSNVTKFEIYRQVNKSGSWVLLATKNPDVREHSDTTAANNQATTFYEYKVLACNDAGCSPPSNTVGMPFKPTDFAAADSSGKIVLTWTDNSDDNRGYEIYRKEGGCNSSASWEMIKSVGQNSEKVSGGNIPSGTTYSYKIRAYCRSWGLPYVYGYSDWSDCISITAP